MKKEIITTPNALREWLPRNNNPIALDTETTSLKYLELDIVGFSLCDSKKACYVHLAEHRDELLGILSYYLNEYEPLVIMHNSPFDLMVLKKVGVI